MPLMTIRTNAAIEEPKVSQLLQACSKKLATLTGKPESYVMTLFGRVAGMTMAGTEQPACLVEIRSVGKLTGEQSRAMSRAFCDMLSAELSVEQRRIYLNFEEVEGSKWGWNGDTFG
jgi:phenylpyruvate tautomerase